MSGWCPYRGLVVTFTTNVAAAVSRAGAGVRAGQLAVEVVTTPAVLTTGAAQWSEWLLSGSRQIREDEYDVAG
jgi:hypothetical protein